MKFNKFLAISFLGLAIMSCKNNANTVNELKTEVDSLSYAVGIMTSQQIKNSFKEVEINQDIVNQGLINGKDSVNLLIPIKDAGAYLRSYFEKLQLEKRKEQQVKAAEKAEKEFGEYKKENEQFLAENKTKSGVQTTESGLQYIVVRKGKGESPKATDTVKLHYKGTNKDGVEFDSSYKRNKPYELKTNQFVPGFSEGLKLMKPGAKYKFFIPQELAYGTQQRGEFIKPFSALVFEVELLEVKK